MKAEYQDLIVEVDRALNILSEIWIESHSFSQDRDRVMESIDIGLDQRLSLTAKVAELSDA